MPPAQAEVDRLEREFYEEFPLALKFQDYENGEARKAEMEALSERFKLYMNEPGDVRTKNLRTGNLNIILEMEAALIIKEQLETNSELGQMLCASFKDTRWDWGRMLRNLDDRMDLSEARPPMETAEQLIAALLSREKHIVDHCQRKQEEASMPDSIRKDIRDFALDLFTRGLVKAYLETVTPAALKEARSRSEL